MGNSVCKIAPVGVSYHMNKYLKVNLAFGSDKELL